MNVSFFQKNRTSIAEKTSGGLIVLSAYTQLQRSNDAAFAFEQEANFWWLTGIDSPDWRVIIDGSGDKTWLVMPKVSDIHQIFDGSFSADQAKAVSGIDTVISDEEALTLLENYAKDKRIVFTLGEDSHKDYYDFALNPAPIRLHEHLKELFAEVNDCRLELAKLRAIKSAEEIDMLKKAISVTIDAFNLVRRTINEYSFEYEVEADFSYHFRRNGASGHAYDPIVAAGKNACTLHYGKNQSQLHEGELLLLDIGARIDGYPADITRTYAYGKVSERHKAVHSEVVRAQQRIIALLRPGLAIRAYFEQVDEIMMEALERLGLLTSKEDYRKYFPHSISHGLGIDVHDSLGSPDTLQVGMVLTVEPGIYIPKEAIGVRIEDDILITESGYENLSAGLSTDL